MSKFLSILSLLGVVALASVSSPAFAQDAETAATGTVVVEEAVVTAEAEPDDGGQMTLLELFVVGGWAMYPLAVASISGFGLAIYNLLVLRPKTFLVPGAVAQVEEALKSGDIEGAKNICSENPAPVTNILYAGLSRIEADNVDPDAMEKAMEEVSTEELAAPFIWVNYLQTVATLSPMIGLLGTVSGMIKAFRTIASKGMGQPQLLADNISEALITTATGLIVAIPAMLCYFIFKNRFGKLASSISRTVGDIHHHFVSSLRRG